MNIPHHALPFSQTIKRSFHLGALVCLTLTAQASLAAEREKNSLDPTKIITKLGVGYTDDLSLSGSLSLDDVRKINGRINKDASDWRLGGSWLFDVGIVNVNFSRSDYDNGGYKNNYSIGSYAPLSRYGFAPGGWMVFLSGGYGYNTGESMQSSVVDEQSPEMVLTSNSTHSGYIGTFAFKPLTEQWNIMAFAGGSMGSDDYRGYWIGGGFSYSPAKQHSIKSFVYVSDDDFGKQEKVGIAYTYEFK